MPVDVNEYFTANDPNFAERLNNPNILTDIFTIKPKITLPDAFKTGEYPTTENKTKAAFSIVQVINNTCTNTADGFTATANNQEFTLRVYPNFSGFKWWNSITWVGTGTITCQMKDAETGTVLISSITSGANLNTHNIEHKPVDIIFTLQNTARVTDITLEYQNQPKLSGSEWSIPHDNITGLSSELDSKADKTTVEGLFDIIYPVGIILEFDRTTNPNTLTGFKGTWTQIKDKFTIAAGDVYTVGQTGGSATHTLSTSEIPAHTHGSKSLTGVFYGVLAWYSSTFSGIVARTGQLYNQASAGLGSSFGGANLAVDATHEHTSVGGGAAHNNMPPFVAVSKWVRTA